MQRILITGAAGFIGYSVAKALLAEDEEMRPAKIIGIDNLDPYYSVALKNARISELSKHESFMFCKADVADHEAFQELVVSHAPDMVLHFAAQAGVRFAAENPFAYARANVFGHLSVLEACRHAVRPPRVVYASSSSVYGASMKTPFSEHDRADRPMSLYAATKRADELISDTYAHLYGIEQVGLRFFTVYGPWGRPDMAYWSFTERILARKPIPVFNNGDQKRDFTYIDDVVEGVLACLRQPPHFEDDRPHRVYNIGNNRPIPLMRFIDVLEDAIGTPAIRDLRPQSRVEVPETSADIRQISADYGFQPKTTIEDGLPRFVVWYRNYFSV